MSFLNSFIENVGKYPDKVALEFIDPPLQQVTYSELNELVNRTVSYLVALGLQPGDRVALQLSKSLEFILLHLATVRLGAISLPLNLAYPPDELEYFLEDSGAKLFFALESSKEKIQAILPDLPDLKECVFLDPSEADKFQLLISNYQSGGLPGPPRSGAGDTPLQEHTSTPFVTSRDPGERGIWDPGRTRRRETAGSPPGPRPGRSAQRSGLLDHQGNDNTAVIIYTSGTTGRPKGAEITHGNLISNLQALHESWGWRSDDILLHVLPIFHVHGLFVALHGALHAGATTLLMREFDARKTLHNLVERRCTVFMAVPTIHQRLLNVPDAKSFDLSHVRLITSGSDRLPDDVFIGIQRTFGHTLLERYGMTETGMNCSNPLHGERRVGSIGFPLPGVEIRIVDSESREALPTGEIGELEVRGPNVFKGYWRQPEKTAESFTADGWFRTGDLGFREPDGYITLCGRSKDLIISGGLNIYPPEVERVLVEHPAVNACVVVGCPDREWGERVIAVVVLNPAEAVSGSDLIAFCRERLAAYKSPKSVLFKDSLPRNAMGKVQKAVLREEICPNNS